MGCHLSRNSVCNRDWMDIDPLGRYSALHLSANKKEAGFRNLGGHCQTVMDGAQRLDALDVDHSLALAVAASPLLRHHRGRILHYGGELAGLARASTDSTACTAAGHL